MSHHKIQKPSFGNYGISKKSKPLTQGSSWTNPYQQRNSQAAQQPANTVKPLTTEEWKKDNVFLKAIETREAQLRQQSIQAKLSESEADLMPGQDAPTSEQEPPDEGQQEPMTVASLPALPSLIPPFVLQRVGSRVSQKLLWQTFWKIIIKRFAIHGAAAATLSAADGPLPIGEIISLGIAVSVLWEIYHLWPELWEQTATEVIEKPPTSTPSEEEKTPNPGQQPKPIPPRIPTQQDQDENKRNYLHAFGNKTHPRPPREGRDIEVDEKGYVNSQPEPGKRWPKGASTFGDPYRAPLTGHFHRIPRNNPMPKGLAVIADGKEVGGRQGETHHTIFPVERMLFLTFSQLFLSLPWVYAGNKK